MSARADARYDEQEWIKFRRFVDAWDTLGGAATLARFCGVEESVVEKWRLGITTPSVTVRDTVLGRMARRARSAL
jgi:hypothetical protein